MTARGTQPRSSPQQFQSILSSSAIKFPEDPRQSQRPLINLQLPENSLAIEDNSIQRAQRLQKSIKIHNLPYGYDAMEVLDIFSKIGAISEFCADLEDTMIIVFERQESVYLSRFFNNHYFGKHESTLRISYEIAEKDIKNRLFRDYEIHGNQNNIFSANTSIAEINDPIPSFNNEQLEQFDHNQQQQQQPQQQQFQSQMNIHSLTRIPLQPPSQPVKYLSIPQRQMSSGTSPQKINKSDKLDTSTYSHTRLTSTATQATLTQNKQQSLQIPNSSAAPFQRQPTRHYSRIPTQIINGGNTVTQSHVRQSSFAYETAQNSSTKKTHKKDHKQGINYNNDGEADQKSQQDPDESSDYSNASLRLQKTEMQQDQAGAQQALLTRNSSHTDLDGMMENTEAHPVHRKNLETSSGMKALATTLAASTAFTGTLNTEESIRRVFDETDLHKLNQYERQHARQEQSAGSIDEDIFNYFIMRKQYATSLILLFIFYLFFLH